MASSASNHLATHNHDHRLCSRVRPTHDLHSHLLPLLDLPLSSNLVLVHNYPFLISRTQERTLPFCAIHPTLSLLVLFLLLFFCLLCVSTVFPQTCSMCMYGRRLKQYLVEIITCLAFFLSEPAPFPFSAVHSAPAPHTNTHGAHVTSLRIHMAFFTDEPMSHDHDACKKGTSHDRPTQLSYTIAGSSEHSNRFVAENILVDLPSDPNSRWSGLHENPSIKQWILLRLDTLCIIGKSLDSPGTGYLLKPTQTVSLSERWVFSPNFEKPPPIAPYNSSCSTINVGL